MSITSKKQKGIGLILDIAIGIACLSIVALIGTQAYDNTIAKIAVLEAFTLLTKASQKGGTTFLVHGNGAKWDGNAANNTSPLGPMGSGASSTSLASQPSVLDPNVSATNGQWNTSTKLFTIQNVESVGYFTRSIQSHGAGIFEAQLLGDVKSVTGFGNAVSGLFFPNISAVANGKIALIPYAVGKSSESDGLNIIRFQCISNIDSMGLNPNLDNSTASSLTPGNLSISQFSDVCVAMDNSDYEDALLNARNEDLEYLGD